MPAVRRPGQGAVALNGAFPYGGQGTAAVSPLLHTLVFAAGGLHAYNARRDSSNNYTRNRQYELGIGTYFNVKQTWLSAAVGGGRARAYRYGRFESSDLIGGGVGILGLPTGSRGRWVPVPELLGYYNTRFAQLTAWWQDAQRPNQRLGATLRLNQVQFTQLLLNGQAQSLPTQHYLQLAVLTQRPLWRQLCWQTGASLEFSLPVVPASGALARAPLRVWVGIAIAPGRQPAE